jgi:hypothetical protein
MSLTQFIYSEGIQQEGLSKYRFVYPLLHFIINEPVRVSARKYKKKTKYTKTVERVMAIVGVSNDNHAFNKIANYVDDAVDMLRKHSNGNFQSNLSEVAKRVEEGVSGKLTMDNIHFGFMHLESTYRKHLKFK